MSSPTISGEHETTDTDSTNSSVIKSGHGQGSTKVLEQSGLEDYEDFKHGLKNTTTTKKEDNGIKMNDVVLFGSFLVIGIIGAYALSYVFGDAGPFSGQVKETSGQGGQPPANVLNSEKKAKKDWQELHTGKGLPLLSDKDIEYTKGGKLYLVVAGHVFDVSGAPKMYGEDSGYHGFVGRDGSRAFVSGKFDEEGLTPDLDGLDNDELKGIANWINFYVNHDDYKFVGLHVGNFYDSNGRETKKMKVFRQKLVVADEEKETEMEIEKLFPGCNMEWSADSGSKLWCSQKSGGVDREWTGLPRLFKPEGKPARCACVHPNHLADERVETYKNCPIDAVECRIKE